MIAHLITRIAGLVACLAVLAGAAAQAQEGAALDAAKKTTLVRAVMCEAIEGYEPVYVGVVFSINVGKISCYTAFENIEKTTYTVHKWYRRDDLVTTKRLSLRPPRWSTYSSIQLREADKGPWRVEVWSADDTLLETLRFSVTN